MPRCAAIATVLSMATVAMALASAKPGSLGSLALRDHAKGTAQATVHAMESPACARARLDGVAKIVQRQFVVATAIKRAADMANAKRTQTRVAHASATRGSQGSSARW